MTNEQQRQVSIRSIFIGAGAALTSDEGLVLQLAADERIVNIDHEGNQVWVYIERHAEGDLNGTS